MFKPPFRLTPKAPVTAYKTYGLFMPRKTHTRIASCAEVECQAWANGWKTIVSAASPQAQYIRARSERAFTEVVRRDGLAEFVFKPGQKCFAEHRVSLQRTPFYIVRGGDWRGATSPVIPMRAEDWGDSLANNAQAIMDAHKRG